MNKMLMTVFLVGLFSATASASPQTDRGYRTCEDAIVAEFKDDGVVPNRTYYYVRNEDMLVFYLNGSLWNDAGERANGRATCYTTANGRKLLEFKAEFGQFSKDGPSLVIR